MTKPNRSLRRLMEQDVGYLTPLPIIGNLEGADMEDYSPESDFLGAAGTGAALGVDTAVSNTSKSAIARVKKSGNRATDKVALADERALSMAKFVDAVAAMQPVLARHGIISGYQFAAGKFTLSGTIAPIASWLRSNGFKEDSNAGGMSASLYAVAEGGMDWPRSLRDKLESHGDDYSRANAGPQRMNAASVDQVINQFIADYMSHTKMRKQQG
jgi:hypothetical protein